MSETPIYFVDGEDPGMQHAIEAARETFPHFWRELAWEQRRIMPALSLAVVKYPFWDEDTETGEQSDVEQMWLTDITFDGINITATLGSSPIGIRSVQEGDRITISKDGISDWMYAFDEKVYGGFTVNFIRQRMSDQDRAEHDTAWGLDFGDPNTVDYATDPNAEHPASISMGESLQEFLDQDPDNIHSKDENGWTMLHSLAFAGSESCVRVLLANGANKNARTKDGRTALQLAESLKWEKVIALLE